MYGELFLTEAPDPKQRKVSQPKGMKPDVQRAVGPRINATHVREAPPWNKGRLIGQKPPLKPKDVWAIRARLQLSGSKRDFALFNLAIDSKLRDCDLVALQVEDVCVGGAPRQRTSIVQNKTGRPVQFELVPRLEFADGLTLANTSRCRCLDRRPPTLPWRSFVSQSDQRPAAPFDPAICPDPERLGYEHRS